MLTAYLVKMAGALALISLVYLAIRLFYGHVEPPPLTDDDVASEVAAHEANAQAVQIAFSADRERAFAITAQGHEFLVGRVGNKLYCRPADRDNRVNVQ